MMARETGGSSEEPQKESQENLISQVIVKFREVEINSD